MCLAQRVIESQGSCRRAFGSFVGLPERNRSIENIDVGESCVSQGIVGVEINSLLKISLRLLLAFRRSLIPEPPAFQIQLIGFDIFCRMSRQSLLRFTVNSQP